MVYNVAMSEITERRYYYEYKKLVLEQAERDKKFLNQIRHLLVENAQLTRELDKSNRLVEKLLYGQE